MLRGAACLGATAGGGGAVGATRRHGSPPPVARGLEQQRRSLATSKGAGRRWLLPAPAGRMAAVARAAVEGEQASLAGFGIELENVSKVFGGRAVVDGINLSIAEGEIVGVLGPNGAGKSTTFSMIVGSQRPTRGSVWLHNPAEGASEGGVDEEVGSGGGGAVEAAGGREEISHLPLHRRARLGVGYLPQDSSIFRGLSVRDNLLLAMEASGVPDEEMAGRAEDLLAEFGLKHVEGTEGRALSGGERRRAELARALAVDCGGRCARLLLVDEPFAGVDPIGVGELQALLCRLRDERGVGVLITDHNVSSALEICDRAYMVYEGRVLAAGPPDVLRADERVRKYYLGE